MCNIRDTAVCRGGKSVQKGVFNAYLGRCNVQTSFCINYYTVFFEKIGSIAVRFKNHS